MKYRAPKRGQPPLNAPRGPSQDTLQSRPGPQRSISGGGGGARGRGSFSRGRGSSRGRGGGRGPAPSASNLDAELGKWYRRSLFEYISYQIIASTDAFMKTPSSTDKPADADVEMA